MNQEPEEPGLIIGSWTTPDYQPRVRWQMGKLQGELLLADARAQARALFAAVAIAESEYAVLNCFSDMEEEMRAAKPKKPQGFSVSEATGRKQRPAYQPFSMSGKVLQMVRNYRPELPTGLDVIIGARAEKPWIIVEWYGEKMQLSPDEVTNHAIKLLEVAESAQSDVFFYRYLLDEVDIPQEESIKMIHQFQSYRNRFHLEEMLLRSGAPQE